MNSPDTWATHMGRPPPHGEVPTHSRACPYLHRTLIAPCTCHLLHPHHTLHHTPSSNLCTLHLGILLVPSPVHITLPQHALSPTFPHSVRSATRRMCTLPVTSASTTCRRCCMPCTRARRSSQGTNLTPLPEQCISLAPPMPPPVSWTLNAPPSQLEPHPALY